MLFERGEATRTIGSGLEAPRDSRGFYPEQYADPRIVRALKQIDRDAHLEWDRERGRWVLYNLNREYIRFPELAGVPNYARPLPLREVDALVVTWQYPDGSYRPLSFELVRQYQIAVWRQQFFRNAAQYDDEILKRQKEAIEQEKERLHAEARGQLTERYWHIKANADKGIYHDPVKVREPKIFSLPTGAS